MPDEPNGPAAASDSHDFGDAHGARLLSLLTELGARCRSTPTAKPGFLLWMSDGEVHDMITEADGYFVLQYATRGAAPQALFASERLEDVAKALVLRLGPDARELARQRPLPLPNKESELAPGCELTRDLDGLRLSWASGGRVDSAWLPDSRSGRIRAVEYSHIAHIPAEELVHAFLNDDGLRVAGAVDRP
jgi:hypothetical protein